MSITRINNEEQKSHHILRISDIVKESSEIFPFMNGYEDMPLVSLESAVEPLTCFLPYIQSYADLAKQRCKIPPSDGLTIDESASIMLYSMGWKPVDQCLYVCLNDTLRSKDKAKVEPWFLYLKLFVSALSRLPSVHQNIYRGIKLDLSKEYQIGEIFSWSGFCSCTSLINILQSEQFFNLTNERTLFTIDSYSAKDIHKHSYFQLEEEFLFLPNTQFNVQGNFNQSNGVQLIRLQQINSLLPLLSNKSFSDNQTRTGINETEKSDVKLESTFKLNDHQKRFLLNDFTVAGGNGEGDELNQLAFPFGLYVNHDDQSIYIADYLNHRIVEWKSGATSGQLVAGGNGMGDKMNQLNCPTNLILDKEKTNFIICDMGNKRIVRWPRRNGTRGKILLIDIDCMGLTLDKNGDLYVSDKSTHEVRRWNLENGEGTLVAGGRGDGNHLSQLDFPTFIVVDEEYSVYVTDTHNNRVMKWIKDAEEGIIVAGGQGKGNGLTQLSNPMGLIVDQLGTVYVTDFYNHRIMRWTKEATQGTIVTYGKEELEKGNKFDLPIGLAFGREGNIYIVDSSHNRVQRFNINQSYNRSIVETESV